MVTILTEILARYGVPDREQQDLLTVVGSTNADIVTQQ